jgi:hypothetical protein
VIGHLPSGLLTASACLDRARSWYIASNVAAAHRPGPGQLVTLKPAEAGLARSCSTMLRSAQSR